MFKTALQFMWFDKAKMFGILFGITLSVFLIGQQIGICLALVGSANALANFNSNYIWVVSDKSREVNDLPVIDMRLARSMMSVTGVKRVSPIVVTGGDAKFSNGKKAALSIIGVSEQTFAGGPWYFKGDKRVLLQSGAVITDGWDAVLSENVHVGDKFEMNGTQVRLVDSTEGARGLGPSYAFASLPLARKLGRISPDRASAFLVEWEDGISPEVVAKNIEREIPGVKARDGKAFSGESLKYIATSSGIVASFGFLVVFAIITGFAIVGLTLFSAVKDRIRDYGTIKAIGGTNGVVRKIILYQSSIYAVVGFSLAMFMVQGFINGTKKTLNAQLPPELVAFMVLVTLFISIISSLFAMRKITQLEPAEVFRM
jgi:putative ABC transport system permease protein